jgi:hypothetical protein
MFLIHLEIDKLEWHQESSSENQWKNARKDLSDNAPNELKFEEAENSEEIIYLLCNQLEDSKQVQFRVEGFGNLPWPVDMSTDLPCVLEQISDLLEFLDMPTSDLCYLDFYEQGIQRRLIFKKQGALVSINCKPFPDVNSSNNNKQTGWGQDIEEDTIEEKRLKNMLCNFVKSFISIAKLLYPTLASNQYFQEWCDNKYIINCLK